MKERKKKPLENNETRNGFSLLSVHTQGTKYVALIVIWRKALHTYQMVHLQ